MLLVHSVHASAVSISCCQQTGDILHRFDQHNCNRLESTKTAMRAAALILTLAVGEAYARPPGKTVSRLVLKNSRGGEESLAAGVTRAAALVDEGALDAAETVLLELRARDARRADLPPELQRGFAQLFRARADEDPSDAGPCDALAALAADAEDWEAVHDACLRGIERAGATERRRALILRARRSTWRGLEEPDGDATDARDAAELVAAGVVAPFSALSLDVSGAQASDRGRRSLEAALGAAQTSSSDARAPRRAGGRVRDREAPEKPSVAFLTPDANGAHPLSQLLPSALCALDEGEFRNIVLVTLCADDGSPERRRVEAGCDVVVEGHASSTEEVANAIADLQVDVLVDMCGHAGSSDVVEILARRPAKVQVAGGLGTPAPMGGTAIYDYALADALVAPARLRDAAGWASDEHRAVLLPHTYQVGDAEAYKRHELRYAASREPTSRKDHGLREDAIVLACMNRPHKVDGRSFEAWVGIVKELAHGSLAVNAQLWLYAPGQDEGASLRTRALQRAATLLPGGLDEARDRLVFAGREDRPAHLERLRHADLALDTRAYNSHTLAADYAWAGVPLCTALCDAEPRWASRVGASVTLSAARHEGAKGLVAADWDGAFAANVLRLARDDAERKRLSVALRRGRVDAPLFSARRWAQGFERAVVKMDLTTDIELPVPVDSCHAIVLGSAPRRVESYEGLVARCPEIKRHKAVEGKDPHALSRALKDLGVRLATDVWQATVGQVACLCSHAQLWRRFAHCPKPFFVVLEDDAVLPSVDAFREAVDQVCRGPEFDVCYLYVYPDHWPQPPKSLDPSKVRVATTEGFRTWCLLAYAVSREGARKLQHLIETEEVYAPIDCMVADWGQRGLLNVRCVDTQGIAENAGQLDMRVPQAGALPSNIWGTTNFGGEPVKSHAMPISSGRAGGDGFVD